MLTFDASVYKITDYTIVTSSNSTDITYMKWVVAEFLAAGWEPYGQLVVAERCYAQIMVKLSPRNPRDANLVGDH